MIRFAIAFAVLLSAAPVSAGSLTFAQSGGSPGYQPQTNHHSQTRILVQFFNDDVLSREYEVFTIDVFDPDGPYTSYATQLVHFDPNYEEVVNYNCTGEDLGDYKCKNAFLSAQVRTRVGAPKIDVRNLPDGSIPLQLSTSAARLYLPGKPEVYWDVSSYAAAQVPAGTWDVELKGVPVRHCTPVAVNARTTVIVAEGTSSTLPNTTIFYQPTSCVFTFTNNGAHGSTISASTGNSCVLDAVDGDTCTVGVPVDAKNLFFTASAADTSWSARMPHNVTLDCLGISPRSQWCFSIGPVNRDSGLTVQYDSVATASTAVSAVGAHPPADRAVDKGSVDNEVAHLSVTASTTPFTVNAVWVKAVGTGNSKTDIDFVHVYADANDNGLRDAGEVELGKSTFGGNVDGLAIIDITNTQVDTTKSFVITVDINDELSAGATFPGAPWSLAFIAALPVLVIFRRRRLMVASLAALLIVGAAYACGGGGGGQNDDDQESDTDTNGGGDNGNVDTDDDQPTDDDIPGGGGPVSFTFSVFGIAASGNPISEGLPVEGATLSVRE